ncbi:MAG: hypothetical protein D6720_00690 [Gammaproteobacteria bacterium]|nr:MAG: hypothetical protein D6720_00690 [Gammaproteobacteria bacterium]
MRTTISDLVIAFLDLLEAEGRTLREQTMRVGWGLAFVLMTMLIALVGLGFLLWGAYQYAAAWLGAPAAALLMALLALILALITGLLAVRWTR